MRWLLGQRLPDGASSRFPATIAPGRELRPARAAWCYGDPGVAAALHLAGATDAAIALARESAARPAEDAAVRDAGLCHGAAGLLHVFNRLWQASGDEALAAAARRWFAHALGLRRAEGVAGFPSWVGAFADHEWDADPGVLAGAAGVALAFVAAATDIAPAWDRFLLLS
jgi:hypothetical protein